MSEEGRRRGDALSLSILLLLVAVLFSDVLFFGARFFLRDLTRYYYPTKHILREMVLRGEFPLWNPLYGAGQPMAANPEYSVFYPLHAVLLLPDYAWAFQFLIVLHVAIGALGMFLYLRSTGMQKVPALFGAVTFAFGGLTLSLLNLLPYLFILAWFPYAFLFVRRLYIRPNVGDFCVAALFLSLQVFTAEPTTLLQVWAIIAIDGVARGFADRPRGGSVRRNIALLALLGVAVGLIAAVQLIPAMDLAGDSIRARGFEFGLASAWSMPVARPLELFFPFVFGHPYDPGAAQYWGAALVHPKQVPFLFSIYLGLMAGALVVAGFLSRVRGWLITGAVCAIGYVLAIGAHTPLFRFLYSLGIAKGVRYPEKFAIMALLIMTIFAARVLDEYLRGDERLRRRLMQVSVGIAVLALAIAAYSMSASYAGTFSRIFSLEAGPRTASFVSISRVDWIIVLLKAIVLLVVVRAGNRGTAPRQWAIVAILFVVLDLASITRSVAPRMPARFFAKPDIVENLKREVGGGRLFPESDWFDYYGFSRAGRLYSSTGAGTYWTARNGLIPQLPAMFDVPMVLERDYDKTALLPTVDLTDAMWKIYDTTRGSRRQLLMAMSNATARTEFRDFYGEVARIAGRPELVQPVSVIHEPSNPRFYFADTVVRAGTPGDFVRLVSSREWSLRTAFTADGSSPVSAGEVTIRSESGSAIDLETRARAPGFLVISITPHKYWRASIDGKPAPLVRANLGYQGLVVTGGRHVVSMRYADPVLKWSGLVSLLAVICALAGAIGFRRTAE